MYYKGVDKMTNKLYEKIKKFMKENGKSILIFLSLYLVLSFPLPYYVYAGGGTIDISKRIDIKSSNKKDYKMYFAYVKELKGNTATYLLSKVFKDWELEKEEDVKLNNDETVEEVSIRDHLTLKGANKTSILLAYQKAGKKVKIKATHPYVFYLEKKESDGVRIGDEIVKVEDMEYKDIDTLKSVIEEKELLSYKSKAKRTVILIKEINEKNENVLLNYISNNIAVVITEKYICKNKSLKYVNILRNIENSLSLDFEVFLFFIASNDIFKALPWNKGENTIIIGKEKEESIVSKVVISALNEINHIDNSKVNKKNKM